ncbi:MAG: glycosyltransferase [Rhodospirillaceae bacterium]|nr:glycosyltransferase [Rhodospirillaceae bacterium]
MPEEAPKTKAKRRAIVVVGMHRSGTSLITRALQALDVSLGKNLSIEASPDNAKGHWEDRDVLAFNERLMAALALEWDLIGEADDALMAAPSLEPLVDEARSLIASKLADHRTWAFKDPRTARLWPFWRRVFSDNTLGKPHFVWVIRHPRPVALSLARRNGFAHVKSHLLWLHHNIVPFEDITADEHVVVDYDRMLGRPRDELKRIAESMRLPGPRASSINEFVAGFLDPDLRHFVSDEYGTAAAGLELVAGRAYRVLLEVACDAANPNDPDLMDQWQDVCRETAAFVAAASRVDASTVAAQSLDRVKDRIVDELGRRQADQATRLQRQVTKTLKDQFTEASNRILDTETRLTETLRRSQGEHAAALQKELKAGLKAKSTETGQRIAELQDLHEATMREQAVETGRRITELQGLHEATMREQAVETGRRIVELQDLHEATLREQSIETGRRFTQLQGLYEAAMREQSIETGRRIDRVLHQLERVEADVAQVHAENARARADLATANEMLNRERFTVLKPMLRKVWRLGVRTMERLPLPAENRLRSFKRLLMSRSIPMTVTIDSTSDQPDAEDDVETPENFQRSPGCFDILVFPVIDWHYRFQRPQQLARQLALRGHRVFYLSTTFEPSEAPEFNILESPAANVALVRLAVPDSHPNIYQDLLTVGQRDLLSDAIRLLVDRWRLENPIAIVDLPFWRPLVETIPGCLTIYDCMDYHAGFSTNSPGMIEEETRLLERADLVVTTSAALSEIVEETVPNLLIRNAGEIAYFGKSPEIPAYASERPVAGYLGAIADWFDIDLVVAAAHRFADWDFILVGSTDHCDTTQARKLPNISFVGEVPYDEAAAWVHSFDVAMIPFQLTELTRCTNPVKVYEYLAAGKPVVATDLPEVQLMSDVVHVADSHEAFMDLLETAMGERRDAALAARRRQSAMPHDWKNRADRLDAAIRSAFPKVSVVVLTYNNLRFTKACLQSLEVNTRYPDWELVLVDNASTDGSRDFLAEYALGKPWVKLIQNEENLGFAAGNNRGLEAATGEYLVVLNNDTYVTRGWLLDFVRHLRKDPQLGLIGAVTNNIGNEAKIDIHYEDMAGMQQAAYAYTKRHAREELDVSVVAFFCTAMPRTLFETVGGLDERFGLGFFEDDDYCRRVAAEGYRIAVAEDVFVHHHLSASFDEIGDERRQALFDRNKALYEEKWGAWTPHRYRGQ